MDLETTEILDFLGKFWEDNAIVLRSKKEISYGDLINSLLSNSDLYSAGTNLGTSHRTLERKLPTLFLDKSQGHTWKLYLLSLIDKKECKKCFKIHYTKLFSRKDIGINSYCKECENATHRIYHIENKEKSNSDMRNHYSKNKSSYEAASAKRRGCLLSATPSWSETKEIALIYKNRPKGYHVDHIIPLVNPLVCGLHVLANLQYLTAKNNLIKSNKFIQE